MARNMKLVTGICACCGKKQDIQVVEYQEVADNKMHLMEYNDFKYVNCNVCNNCGYAAANITKLIGSSTKVAVKNEAYHYILDNGFMAGFEDLDYQEYLETNVAQLDAMSMLYEIEGKTNLTYARLTSRIADIKSALRGEYSETMYGLDEDDEDYKVYQALIKTLTDQINEANAKCYKTLKTLKIQYPYEVLFVAECLTKVNKYKKARELIADLEKHFELDKELKAYVENFLTEVEVI